MVRRLALFALLASVAPASSARATDFTGWEPAGYLRLARTEPVATRLADGRVLLTGGQAPVPIVAASELYDPTANRWAPAAPMKQARLWPAVATLTDGRVLVAGGVQDENGIIPLFSGEVYDPGTNTWTPTGQLHAHHARGNAIVLKDGRVLVVSASGDPDDGLLGCDRALTAEIYDPATNAWALTGSMAVGRIAPALALLPDGRVLAAGGACAGAGASVEIYDAATNTWTTATPMNRPRANAGAATLPDGRVLVAGGDDFTVAIAWDALTSAEIFDPATGTWTLTGSMAQQRGGDAMMTTLADGRAVFVGGATYDPPDSDGVIPSRDNTVAEVFDPTSGTWSATPPTLSAHSDGIAVGLLDGSLLVVGGYENRPERLLAATPTPTPTPTATPTVTATPMPESSNPVPAPPPPSPHLAAAAGRLAFSGLPRTLHAGHAGVINVNLRCSGAGACHDTLTLKRGHTTLLRRTVTVAAAKKITLRLTLSTPTRRAITKRAVSLNLALITANLKRSVTVRN